MRVKFERCRAGGTIKGGQKVRVQADALLWRRGRQAALEVTK